ncbi:MAG: DUF58 domain-containing protein [Gemmatimonadota bacterium]|nr:DUF58 domain-containing protein [Gemmatimonadota bacterium]MDH5284403.1 DUF58 domain-containing protein [Gemmatimonadota bacterium]
MIFIPDRRWLLVALALAALAPLALVWPATAGVMVLANGIWVLIFVVDAWWAGLVPADRLLVEQRLPPAFSVGRPLPMTLVWHNPLDRTLSMRLRLHLPPQLARESPEGRIALPAGGTLRQEIPLRPLQRGRASGARIDLRIRGPWGLSWRQVAIRRPWEVTVYPRFTGAALRSLPTQLQRRREAGLRAVRRIGEGRVFESLREWVPGEDTRTIDWKATARRGKVMARQYEDERRQQVLIVIDAGRTLTAESGGRPRLEAVVEAALQLAHGAIAHDDNVGLMVFADRIQQFIAPGRGRRALRAVLDGLAGIEGRLVEPDYPLAFATLAARTRRRALTVLFTDVIDRTASEALVAHTAGLRPRHLPLAVALRDPAMDRLATVRPASSTEAFERAAAEELLQAREEALGEMRRAGVIVLDVPPEDAGEAVVAQYHSLKRRGVL